MTERSSTNLTILFADLCRSTSLFDQLGDEAALALEMDALQMAGNIAKEHNGKVIGTIGDEVMCTFDSTEAALLTANDIHAQIRLKANLKEHHLAMRVGINQGPVVRSDESVYGDVVNIAARLAQQAKANQSLVSTETLEHVGDKFNDQLRPLGKISLQGKAGMIEVHELLTEEDTGEITEVVLTEEKPSRAYLMTVQFLTRQMRFDPMLVRFLFGRSIDCDQPMDHPTISREHAELTYRNGQFELRDFSSNGTVVVHGNKIEPVHRSSFVLRDKGEIYLGRTLHQRQFRIEYNCISHR